MEAASLIAVGRGVAFLFGSTNIGLDLSFGVRRAFNGIERQNINDFAETFLAANLAIAKFWWISGKTSVGVSLSSGVHGLTISKDSMSTLGLNAGLNMVFLLG